MLYPKLNYSIGFTSRGCIRKCSFCIVPEKEGYIKEWSSLEEFVRHKKVILLDNNFLASTRWKFKLLEMIERNLIVDFNQGLDIRLIDEEKAALIVKLNPPYLRFAWDDVKDEAAVRKGISILKKEGFPIDRHRIGFYVLVGYNSTLEEDLHRANTLHGMDINTHVQLYKGSQKTAKILARWANRPWYWMTSSFEEFEPIKNLRQYCELFE
jgi:hypothetical protein